MATLDDLLASLPARIDQILSPSHLAAMAVSESAPALIQDGRQWSYQALAGHVTASAALLGDYGVRAGDRVMLVGENSAALAVLILALSRLDAWAVIVNARLNAHEIDALQAHCQPRCLLYTVNVSPDAAAHSTRHAAQPLLLPGVDTVAISALDTDSKPEPVHADPARQVAALIYTSGTTGQPKGVMLTHRNLLFIAAVSSRLRGLTPSDRAYGVLPVSHVFGLASVFLGTLYAGASLQLVARFEPAAVLHALQDDLSVLQGVPAMFAKLFDHIRRSGQPLLAPRLRFLYAGGSPLDPSLKARIEQAFGVTLHNGYGLSETSPTVCQTRPENPRSDCSVGPPIPFVEVQLRALQGGGLVATGETGELWVRGPNVMLGYYRNPAQTAEVIDAEGWLNTGDLARQVPDGALFIEGRSKELIIRSGFNVYPLDIETVLNTHPEVVHSAVVGRSVADNEEVIAFVELAPGSRLDTATLSAFAAARLAAYKRPSEIIILPALPAAANGKVLKNQLKTLACKNQTDGAVDAL